MFVDIHESKVELVLKALVNGTDIEEAKTIMSKLLVRYSDAKLEYEQKKEDMINKRDIFFGRVKNG